MAQSKITFIYAYEEENWSTPMALANEFMNQGWECEVVSIGSNRTGQYHDRGINEWLDKKPNSDIVIFLDWGRFDSPLLNKEKLS